MAAAKNTGKNTDKRGTTQNLRAPWKPGQSGNPSGRKLGVRNRKTVIMDAMIRIAEAKKIPVEDIEEIMHASAIDKAMKGSFFHYAEISNGLYGKMTDKTDLTSGGKTIADLITIAHGKAKRGASASAEVSG